MSFQIHALPAAQFAALFLLDNAALASRQARRMTVPRDEGVPCRVSLADAEVGETVLLLNYAHQTGDSPYRSQHAIYVRERAAQCHPPVGTVPDMIRSRLVSIRWFDAEHFIVDADVLDGESVADAIESGFSDPRVDYAHLHFAKPGCFAASVTRAS